MSEYAMTIDGRSVRTQATLDVEDPATGEFLAHAPECTRSQLDDAMAAASASGPAWAADEQARRLALTRISRLLDDHSSDLGRLLVQEQGKPLRDAVREVATAALWFRHYAAMELPSETIQDDGKALVRVVRRPVGVVAAIAPWNYPIVQASWKLAPAFLAGNTVVLKPSPFTPLATLRVGELLAEALPPGVLNVVSGGDELGAWMTEHPVPRKVSFTGSVDTGRKVAIAAAPDLKRVTLELGGNDAAIVLDDMDPTAAANGLFAGAFANCGQVCTAIKRAYVHRGIYDDVVAALIQKAEGTVVGPGLHDDVTMGPLCNRAQLDRITELVRDADDRGAQVTSGRLREDLAPNGWFHPATIVADAREGMRIVDEEQFGPALPVLAYDDPDEAVERANATQFGLSGSVWSADPDRAGDVASRLDCGTTWINTHRAIGPHQPITGRKWSGIGAENGTWGLDEFTTLQVIHRAKAA